MAKSKAAQTPDRERASGDKNASSPPPSTKAATAPAAGDAFDLETVFPSAVLATYHIYFAALNGALSQLMLSPVYGSLIASENHYRLTSAGLIFGFMLKAAFPDISLAKLRPWIPIVPFYIPLVQGLLFHYSDVLGATWGPLVTESVTFFPFLFLCAVNAADELSTIEAVRRRPLLGLPVAFIAYFVITIAEPTIIDSLGKAARISDYLTKVWLYLGSSAVGLSQSTPFVSAAALPAIALTLQFSPHLIWQPATARLNKELVRIDHKILERKESNSGYISVVEDYGNGYRVLRCDHSILGGEWQMNERAIAEGMTGPEPIYAVFELLEAVRLVETADLTKADKDKAALFIGLGVGTAPKALQAHGVKTTVVELDPVVYDFAVKYFDLPTNHTAHLEDAVAWVKKTNALATVPKYDFIIHDVFTGGAEPLFLFTESFIGGLKSLLSENGVIAINYAGNANAQPTKSVLNTINTVFEGRCRIFRDLLPEPGMPDDFANMIIFCLAPTCPLKPRKPEFRRAVEADYLGSLSRRHQLQPKETHELPFPTEADMRGENVKIMRDGDVGSFLTEQLEGAKRHWGIMRMVLPSEVWIKW